MRSENGRLVKTTDSHGPAADSLDYLDDTPVEHDDQMEEME